MFSTTLSALALFASVASVAGAPSEPLFARSWGETVSALAARNQSWTGRQVSRQSNFQFDIGCIGEGPGQDAQFTDIFDAVNSWFGGSNTGATCAANQERRFGCAPAGAPATACLYDGSYAVWNNGIMDCFAFVALQSAVTQFCADAGHPDCGCGVYFDFGSGKCLVASYTYHLSGTGVVNDAGSTGEPVTVVTNVNHRRDSLGPFYTDLSICGRNGNDDVTAWCEASATHVC